MLNRVGEDVQIPAGNEDAEPPSSLGMEFVQNFNCSFVNVNLMGKVNTDKLRFDFFYSIYCFLRCVIAAWKKGREVIFMDYSCFPLRTK